MASQPLPLDTQERHDRATYALSALVDLLTESTPGSVKPPELGCILDLINQELIASGPRERLYAGSNTGQD